MDDLNFQIGQNIKRHRKGKFTQTELAKQIGKTESSIRKYEKGIVTIPLDTIEKIASALGISAFQLMGADYFDVKYPDITKKSNEYEGFVDYLQCLGYTINETSEFHKTSQDEVPDDFRDALIGETCSIELIKDGASTVLDEVEFQQLHSEIKDSIAFKLWKKGQKE